VRNSSLVERSGVDNCRA